MEIEIKGDIINDDDAWFYNWFGDSYTSPKAVTSKLKEANGQDIEVKINSPGGDVFSASEIYTALREYKGNVVTKITGIAASAASIIAMSGSKVLISPTAQIMIHNVSSCVGGDYRDMDHMSEILKNANEAVANAYINKTGKSKEEILNLMNNETYINAEKAKELGFADEIMFEENKRIDITQLSNFKHTGFYNSIDKHQFVENFKIQNNFSQANQRPKNVDFFNLQKNKMQAELEILKMKEGV